MNMILLHPDDFISQDRAVFLGRRAAHIHEVHRAVPGEMLKVGLLGGRLGVGTVQDVTSERVTLVVSWSESPPAPLPVTLLLAMPRPKCFRRILQCVTTMGVKRVALFGAFRVEKSYWKSPWVEPDEMRAQMILGLEQARDTVMPEVTLHPLFKPFVEDTVPALIRDSRCLVAHPGGGIPCPAGVPGSVTLAIGPEGGFTEYELGLLADRGFAPVILGRRILRTEQAVPAFLGRLMAG